MGAPVLQGRPSLAELYEGVSRAEDPELAVLRLTLDGAARRDPELPRLARIAAIPRRFDLEVIARLRGESQPGEETERLLRSLVALPLVRSRNDGSWSITDTVRDLLLAEWRAEETASEEFERHNATLSQLYRERLEQVVEEERTLGMVSGLLRRVSPERYGLLVAHIESRQIARLLEALYHETLRSAAAGFEYFSLSFQSHESEGRMAVCQSLLAAMRDFLERLPGQASLANLRLWLRYYEARLAARVREHRRARLILEELHAAPGDDRKLQLWVLSELGGLYQSTCHYRAARKILEEELEVATSSRADPYNIPTSLLRLASLHRALSNLERATRLLRDAIRSAVAEGRSEIELSARLELSRVLLERGDVPGARQEALRALDHARREPLSLRHMQDGVADVFMMLQAHDEPALVDTLFEERLGLIAAIAEEGVEASLYLEYSNHLRAGGQFSRAVAMLQGPASAAGQEGRSSEALYLLRLALTAEEMGRMEEAASIYGRLIEAARRRPAERFNAAAAFSNRGAIYRDRNDTAAALHDCAVARKRWRRMGVAKLAAVMDVLTADTLLAAARRRQLADPDPGDPGEADPALAAETAAELVFETASWDEANRSLEGALAQAKAAVRPAGRARLLGRLACVAGAQVHWREAASRALDAAAAWREVPPRSADHGPAPRLPAEALAAVRARLEAAGRHVNFEVPPFQGDLHHVRARYHTACGEHERAYALLLLAAKQPEAISDRNGLAGIHFDLARTAGRLDRPDAAAQHAEAAARVWQRLAANDAYQASEQAARADSENERGLRAFTASVSTRASVVRAARDLFLAASQRLPANWWYALNLSYASGAAGEWEEAANALEESLRHGPDWLGNSVLSLRLATYRIERSLVVARSSGDEAARALRAAAELLERCEPADPGLHREYQRYWSQLGDGFNFIDRLDDAASCYQRALTHAEGSGGPANSHAELHARLALLLARRGRTAAAAARLRLGAGLIRGGGPSTPYETLASSLHSLLRSAEDYDAFAEVLRNLSRDLSMDAEARRQVIKARLELNRSCFQPTHQPGLARRGGESAPERSRPEAASPGTEPARPMVTPTALNGHPGLFPAGEAWADGHPLFADYIPAMRARVAADLGVRLPGIRVRSDDDLQPGGYAIILDEVPVAAGVVAPGGRFCPDVASQANAVALSGSPARDPRTGEESGVWLDDAGLTAAAGGGVATWDHLEYMIRHLEQLQREQVTLYIGLQELDSLLSEWKGGRQGEAQAEAERLVAAALPDLSARLRYLQVLHALLREGVGVTDQASILRAFAARSADHEGVRGTVEAVRLAQAAALPGNRQASTVLRCSPAFEARLAAGFVLRGRTRALALTPEVTSALLGGIRATVGALEQRRVALVTRTPELRPLVRALAEVEFPHLHVLAEPELAQALRERNDGVIEAETSP
jgi:tetratricopeptide (TPR) repeat protein